MSQYLRVAIVAAASVLGLSAPCQGQGAAGPFTIVSPDGRMTVSITTGAELTYAVSVGDRQVVRPSPISMTLDDGRVLGRPATVGPPTSSTRTAFSIPSTARARSSPFRTPSSSARSG